MQATSCDSAVLSPRATNQNHTQNHSHQRHRQLNPEIWNVQPPAMVVEAEDLEIGEVDTFFPERGFGFIEYAGGRIFFHASGFRMPRMMQTYRDKVPCQEIQLALIRTRQDEEEKQRRKAAGEKASHVPLPPIYKGLGLMFQVGEPKGRPQASKWCLQETYKTMLDHNREQYSAELASWKQLGRYKLELCEVRQTSVTRADNQAKRHVPETKLMRTTLFEGTNTEFLKGWFNSCIDGYRLPADGSPNPQRYVELSFQVSLPSGGYSEWEACDSATMHDFLGQ